MDPLVQMGALVFSLLWTNYLQGIAVAVRPGLAIRIISFPFRVIHAKYYFLAGPHRRELQRLAQGAKAAYEIALNELRSKNLDLGGIEVNFSRAYIASFEEQFRVGNNLSSIKNPQLPPFIKMGRIEDTFGVSRMVIALDDRAVYVLTIVAMWGLSIILIKVFRFAVRRIIRYGTNGYLLSKEFVRREMRQADYKKQLSQDKSQKQSFYSDRNIIDTSIEK